MPSPTTRPGSSPSVPDRGRWRTRTSSRARAWRRCSGRPRWHAEQPGRGVIESPAPNAHTLVADQGREVVGFASLGRVLDEESEPEHVGELYTIYVLPDAWGRGVGQALVTEVLRRLRGEGFGEAILWVIEDNTRTRRFSE